MSRHGKARKGKIRKCVARKGKVWIGKPRRG
jgi:hypothetical protein